MAAIDWTSVIEEVIKGGAQVGSAALQQKNQYQNLQQGPQTLQTALYGVPAPSSSGMMPLLLLALGGGALFYLTKKK